MHSLQTENETKGIVGAIHESPGGKTQQYATPDANTGNETITCRDTPPGVSVIATLQIFRTPEDGCPYSMNKPFCTAEADSISARETGGTSGTPSPATEYATNSSAENGFTRSEAFGMHECIPCKGKTVNSSL